MKKLRILLVEDEDIIRRGLKHMIEKLNLDLDIIEAGNGVEALEICSASEINILLTDISMPQMDGLSLISILRERSIDIPCIIFSGYRDFDYARKAIQYGVEDYLLKPVERADLRQTLEKVISSLNTVPLMPDSAEIRKQQEREQQIRDLWVRVLSVGYTHLNDSDQALISDVDFNHYALLLLSMYKPGGELYEELLKLEKSYGRVLCNYTASNGYVFHLLSIPNDEISAFKEAYLHLNHYVTSMVSVLSAECHSLKAAATVYRQCTNQLNTRLIRQQPAVQIVNGTTSASSEIPTHYFLAVRNALSIGNSSHVSSALHRLFNYLLADSNMTPELLTECFHNLELYLLNNQKEQMIQIVPTRSRLRSLDHLLSSSETIKDFEEAVYLRIQLINDASTVNTPRSPISIVLDYIENHYHQDISAVYCSNLISMNTSYFSTYFKKKTGLSFVNYLQQFRVRKSAELLKKTDLRIYEIAEKVGFTDDKYFFKVFKQYYSVTPSEFREPSNLSKDFSTTP